MPGAAGGEASVWAKTDTVKRTSVTGIAKVLTLPSRRDAETFANLVETHQPDDEHARAGDDQKPSQAREDRVRRKTFEQRRATGTELERDYPRKAAK